MNTDDLYRISKKLGFKINGIYYKDDKIKLYNGSYIINLDSKNSGKFGTHWTAFYINNGNVYYFDSFGVEPPIVIQNLLKRKYKNIWYNNLQYQNLRSSICGLFAIYFLFCMENDISYYNFLYNVLKPYKINYNEKLLKHIFGKL